jgi:hypothetical protein
VPTSPMENCVADTNMDDLGYEVRDAARACCHLIQSQAAARQRTPVKLAAVFS